MIVSGTLLLSETEGVLKGQCFEDVKEAEKIEPVI